MLGKRLLVLAAVLLAATLLAGGTAQATSSITVDDTATIVGNTIVVTGTYSCDAIITPTASVGVTLFGPGGATQGGTATPTCPAANAAWQVVAPRGSIRPGSGTVLATLAAPGSGNATTTEPVTIV
jgi:hypothetical protein